MKILAISSGKGGVGKTTLTLNIARQLSLAGLRTLIVDFDIHNKGTTNLFLDSVSESSVPSLIGVVERSASFDEASARASATAFAPLELHVDAMARRTRHQPGHGGKLFLIPAARPDEIIHWERFVSDPQLIALFLRTFLESVGRAHQIDVAIIDCYGGIDRLTISAASVADDFIILNEADVITFAGTLLLYKQIQVTYEGATRQPRVHFVISRIPGRYSFRFLSQMYREQLAPLATDKAVLAYLPFDKLVFDTFGEYPFFSELLPKGLYAKKIRELIARLWPEPAFERLTARSARKRRRIYEATAEQPFADPERIFHVWQTATGWALLPIAGLILLWLLGSGAPSRTISFFTLRTSFYICLIFVSAVVLLATAWEPVQVSRWLLRKARYDRNKRRLVFGRRMTAPFRSVTAFVLSLVPGVIGAFCFTSISALAISQASFPHLRNVTIWQGGISGLLPHSDYRGAMLARGTTVVSGTELTGSDFSGAKLAGVRFPDVTMNHIIFNGATLSRAILVGAELDGASFSGANGQDVDLSASKASGAIFSYTKPIGANFWGATLTGARFDDTTLYRCDFRRSVLRNARFDNAKIGPDTRFDGADLRAADFRNANFDSVELRPRADLLSRLLRQGAMLSLDQLRWLADWDWTNDEIDKSMFERLQRTNFAPREIEAWISRRRIPAAVRDRQWVDQHIDDYTRELKAQKIVFHGRGGTIPQPPADQTIERAIVATVANLVELQVLRRTGEDTGLARAELQFLLANVEQPELQSSIEDGAAYFFDAVLGIVDNDHMDMRVRAWISWIREHDQLAGWEWDTFDANFDTSNLTRGRLALIRTLRLSAAGTVSSDDVAHWLTALESQEPPAPAIAATTGTQ
jgi:uncharacterized protein YjbI with pentapeptide repeats/cellulose biosynthesis protein BcsQ